MIIICDDGKSRRFQGQENIYDHREVKYTHFKDVSELREEKLNQLGIWNKKEDGSLHLPQ